VADLPVLPGAAASLWPLGCGGDRRWWAMVPGALRRLGRTKRVRMVDGIRNYVERFFLELKQGLKPFDVSFPQRRLGLTSLSAPLAGAVCLALQPVPHGREVICLILTAPLDIKPSSGITPLGLQYPISSHFLNTN
jgi:hypothetical protein